ncbi:ABC transporter permease [Flavihumibacter petaseus]|uniref:ABC transporter permease protein n=1 Tax=Flavihumibacter petaseus NBRC 106054 TaxID=1220578 RepID=A0A0E9N1W1_9BACT|nr:ABC transporter permease [Flavihumibacter petaseus]GAO43839.1 hypothetical protein FPE01S_02_09450 [Flavihumibacter petaseus NBRC 106054]
MFTNYLKIAFRSTWKNKFHSAISISGLVLGLTAGILILIWCQDERSYNQASGETSRVYRAIPNFKSGAEDKYFPTVPSALDYVAKDVPGIELSGLIIRNWNEMVLRSGEKIFSERNSAFVDPELFAILGFSFSAGNRNLPFRDNRSIVLTEAFAKKYFGDDNAIGKSILREDQNETYTVTGVVKTLKNSQVSYDFFLPVSIINQYFGNPADPKKGIDGDWRNYDYEMYMRLKPGVKTSIVASQLTGLQKENVSDEITKTLQYSLQPLADIHLYQPDGSPGLITIVRIFTWVAFVILFIAAINYINLSTARAAQRAREVGVRKVIGAARHQLFFQFIMETLVVFVISMAISLLLIALVFPLYNSLTGKDLVFDLFDLAIWKVLGASMLVTLLAASVYPAILLSAFQPIQAIRGKFSIGRGNHYLRKILQVTQFGFSVVFIICTIIMGRQLNYVQTKNLGINKDGVFRLELKNMRGKYDAVRNELLKESSIAGISAAGQDVLQVGSNTTMNDWPGKDPSQSLLIFSLPVERDFPELLQLKLAEGQGFTGTAADSGYFLLNETAIAAMGLKDPVGKSFTLYNTKGTIAGIVKDFHFRDMHQKIAPCVIFWKPGWAGQLYVRPVPGKTTAALAAVKKLWTQHNPANPFEYNFLDDSYNKLYQADQRMGELFKVFAVVAILISCLGLFGLMAYTAQLKTREIGIRKVLGASVASVIALLARDYVRLVLLAIVIAFPLGWYGMDRWLQDFAYRVPVRWWIFPLAGGSALLVAVLTIGFQAIRTAVSNPVKSLRTE